MIYKNNHITAKSNIEGNLDIVGQILETGVGAVHRDDHRSVVHVAVTVHGHVQGHLSSEHLRRRHVLGTDNGIEVLQISAGPVSIFTLDHDQRGQGIIVAVSGDHLQGYVFGQHARGWQRPRPGELILHRLAGRG